MSGRSVDVQTLEEVALELGFEISREDLAACSKLLGGMLDEAPKLPHSAQGAAGVEREWWHPSEEENPHAAWHVRTRLRLSEVGELVAGAWAAPADQQA